MLQVFFLNFPFPARTICIHQVSACFIMGSRLECTYYFTEL
jgi:hypothetical protein